MPAALTQPTAVGGKAHQRHEQDIRHHIGGRVGGLERAVRPRLQQIVEVGLAQARKRMGAARVAKWGRAIVWPASWKNRA
jgi:hypothetical protein